MKHATLLTAILAAFASSAQTYPVSGKTITIVVPSDL